MKTNRIGIIGMGWVGSSVASSILHNGFCKELLLNDVREGLAEGEAMDFNHGSSFYPTASIRSAEIEEMRSCQAIVITAGRGGNSGETRLELLKDNIGIAKKISDKLKGYEGILVIVANPVDVLTYFYQKFSGLPASRVIGTGTMLDTARLRSITGTRLNLDPRSIHAQVIGEHGDSEVVLWSRATIGGDPLRNWEGWQESFEVSIAEEVRKAAQEIIKRKGATNHAIGLVTATLLKWVLRGERRIITLSSTLSGQFGLNDLALSLPCLVSDKGIEKMFEISMNAEEKDGLLKSAEVINKAIKEVID
ncbi:L-lactate dehydrogenase [Ekhidna sp.]|jgi:L-lactate dehydrogenase|uniref:L-lactate dehydrogenase n=1 Tax=Ekhidna sp. TaxID=2608089 RepID=UPI0032ED3F02